LRLDKQVGSIEVGKQADLIVLERNLFSIPASQIAKTAIKMTMVGGRFTHRPA
jgi:predicted amidohydrolase YtcJ